MPKYVLKELPGDMTEGRTVIYPKMKTYSLYDYEIVIYHMCKLSSILSEAAIRAVFCTLVEEMQISMPLGHNIKIDGLGVFSLSLGFDTSTASEEELARKLAGEDDDDPKLKYRHVCIKGINFKPDPDLLKEMNRLASFENAGADIVAPRESIYSYEERQAKARAIIDKQGFMTLSDYADATGQSKTGASRDLKRLVADASTGIVAHGDYSHKIWVKSKINRQ
jgi:hypothetical protein